jgi:uncharacterized protein with NRDE domain
MCLVALAFRCSTRFPLVIAANRDEFFARATAPLDWWSPGGESPAILGGRDLQQGGTWLGLTRAGRLALVTNVREPQRAANAEAPSRGAIVALWLRGDLGAAAFAERIAGGGYNGFNVVACDLRRGECFHVSNRSAAPSALSAGVHGVSNAGLDEPWPKVVALKARLASAVRAAASIEPLSAALFDALADPAMADDARLPATGVPLEWERRLSAAFVRAPAHDYGTRSSTVVAIDRDGVAHVVERSFERDARCSERRAAFAIEGAIVMPSQSARRMSTCATPASA